MLATKNGGLEFNREKWKDRTISHLKPFTHQPFVYIGKPMVEADKSSGSRLWIIRSAGIILYWNYVAVATSGWNK